MKANGIFVILITQDGFESDCQETKQSFCKVSSEGAVGRCYSKQVLESLFSEVEEETPTQVFSC